MRRDRYMPPHLRVLQTRLYANALVLELDDRPEQGQPHWHWRVRTERGRWQIGWVLEDPVRVAPWRDGGRPHPGPVTYLSDAIQHLMRTYGGHRVTTYLNPSHAANRAEVTGVPPVRLRALTDFRALGGRSRSAAKIRAARANLEAVNEEQPPTAFIVREGLRGSNCAIIVQWRC